MTRIDLARASDLGSGIPAGTAFPGTPSTDDLFHHTTYDMVFYYDGTRWLCMCGPHVTQIGTGGELSATGVGGRVALEATNDVYVVKATWMWNVLTTNNGTSYWAGQLLKVATAGSSTEIAADNTSTGITAGSAYAIDDAVGDVMDVSTHPMLAVLYTKVSAPGNLRGNVAVHWRHIGV